MGPCSCLGSLGARARARRRGAIRKTFAPTIGIRMRRRDLLKASATLAAAGFPLTRLLAADPASAAQPKILGQAQPFDYAWLKGQARALAAAAYGATNHPIPDEVKNLGWDQYQ